VQVKPAKTNGEEQIGIIKYPQNQSMNRIDTFSKSWGYHHQNLSNISKIN